MHPKHSSSIPTAPMRKGHSIMALKMRLHLHPCTLLGAVNAWVDLSDRKNPSLSPSCGWMPLLNVQGRVWRPTTTFPPSAPLGSLHYSKKTFTEPCTSLYIFGTKLDLPTSQTQKKGRRRRKERGVKKKKMKAAFKKFILSSLLLIPYCLVPINGAGILWELSIYHSWDFHVSAVPQKKVRQLSDMLLKATNVQHKHREFNAGFFFPLAVLQLLSFCLAMQHTQKGTKQKIASMFNSRLASTESSAPHKSSAQKSHLLLEA